MWAGLRLHKCQMKLVVNIENPASAIYLMPLSPSAVTGYSLGYAGKKSGAIKRTLN
jgi:hypothetical protein